MSKDTSTVTIGPAELARVEASARSVGMWFAKDVPEFEDDPSEVETSLCQLACLVAAERARIVRLCRLQSEATRLTAKKDPARLAVAKELAGFADFIEANEPPPEGG